LHLVNGSRKEIIGRVENVFEVISWFSIDKNVVTKETKSREEKKEEGIKGGYSRIMSHNFIAKNGVRLQKGSIFL